MTLKKWLLWEHSDTCEWSSRPIESRGKRYKMMAWMFPHILCMILISSAAHATTYYVSTSGNDGNPGTSNSRWRTITKCAAVMVAGDTCIIGNGTYVENTITPTTGISGSPITFIAENKWLAILSVNGTCGAHGFNFNEGKSYIILDGVKIQQDASYVCADPFNGLSAAVKGLGTQLPHITGPATTGNCCITVRNVYIAPIPGFQVGIKINQDQSLIENNEVHSSLEALNSEGSIFRGNTMYESDAGGDTFSCKGGARNCQFYNNILHKTKNGEGILLGGASGIANDWDPSTAFECYNCIAYNNVVINEFLSDTQPALLGMRACSNCSIFNNVVMGGQLFMGPSNGANNANPTFKNNIVTCGPNGAATSSFNGWATWVTGTLTVDFNDFFSCTSGIPSQVHPITGDPKFVNSASDWHLQAGSPAIDAGTPITNIAKYGGGTFSGLNLTMSGVLRPVGSNWDLGVYESGANDTSAPSTPKNLRVL